jgi:hypothetical protein
MYGTYWTVPGNGATIRQLLDRTPSYILAPAEFISLRPFLERRTELALNGNPLRDYDLDRIREAIRRIQEGASNAKV